MKIKKSCLLILALCLVISAPGCKKTKPQPETAAAEFRWQVDQFADLKILRYKVPGFEELSPRQKELIYYLSEAALCGRDIVFAQNYKHNLLIRKTLDAIVEGYKRDRSVPPWEWFMVCDKRVWFPKGIT